MSNLNKALLIGRLTKDPEMRYTPSGTAVTNFSIATNRWSSGGEGERKEFTDYHNIVAYNAGKSGLVEETASFAPCDEQVNIAVGSGFTARNRPDQAHLACTVLRGDAEDVIGHAALRLRRFNARVDER